MKNKLLYCLMSLLGSAFIGCDSGDIPSADDDADHETEDQDQNWLVRTSLLESSFIPTDIESALDDLTAALNDTPQVSAMKLAVIPKDMGDYFKTAVLGANRAIGELGVVGSVVSPDADNTQQEVYIGQHMEDGFSGIGVAPTGAGVVPAIDAAVDAGVIVVTFDSDEATSKRQFYIGTINYEAGKTAGNTMVDLIGDDIGTVIILGQDESGWADGYERTRGAAETIEAAGHTVVIQNANWSSPSANVAPLQTAIENANPKVVGLLGVFSNSFACADAAEAAGVLDDVKIGAFDFEPTTLEYLESGKIDVTHGQRQYYMGYLVPYVMYAATVLGEDAVKDILSDLIVDGNLVNTGLDIVPSDKVDEYNAFLDSLGIL